MNIDVAKHLWSVKSLLIKNTLKQFKTNLPFRNITARELAKPNRYRECLQPEQVNNSEKLFEAVQVKWEGFLDAVYNMVVYSLYHMFTL